MSKSNRNIFLRSHVSSEEKNIIKAKMEQTGIISLSAYLRKMALDGYMVKLDVSEVREMITLLRCCQNNLDQIARHVNSTDSDYAEGMEEIMCRQRELWRCANMILKKLASIS